MDISKKSLGHFPFEPSEIDESEYSFIPDINRDSASESYSDKETGESTGFDLNHELYKIGNDRRNEEEISEHLVEREVPEPTEEPAPKKKVASYYLEVDLIDRLKRYSDNYNRSYSAVVTDAIEGLITKKGF